MNPRKVNCADFTSPPTVGRPSSTTQRKPAFDKYAAVIRLLCPAPATTISKRSEEEAFCAAPVSDDSASGARAAPLTNPRRVIPLMSSSCCVRVFQAKLSELTLSLCRPTHLSIAFVRHSSRWAASRATAKALRSELKYRMMAARPGVSWTSLLLAAWSSSMNSHCVLAAFLIFLGGILSSPASAVQARPKTYESDEAAIKQVFTDFYESFSRHDAHAVAMTFAEDGDFTNM